MCSRHTIVVITITVETPSPADCTYVSLRRWLQHRRQHHRRICKDNLLRLCHAAIIQEHAHDVGTERALKTKKAAWHTTM